MIPLYMQFPRIYLPFSPLLQLITCVQIQHKIVHSVFEKQVITWTPFVI